VDTWLHRPVMSEPPLCSLRELQDGTYSICDVADMNEMLDLKASMKPDGSSR